ncbi:MAG: hypothetical protein RLZZ507_1394 [Cyanobacteriota bacterium]
MSENFTANHENWFFNLSEAEQETLAAGQSQNMLGKTDLFFQNTNIETEADRNLNIGGDSDNQRTKYRLSQITIGSSMTFFIPDINSGVQGWNNLLNTFLGKLFS